MTDFSNPAADETLRSVTRLLLLPPVTASRSSVCRPAALQSVIHRGHSYTAQRLPDGLCSWICCHGRRFSDLKHTLRSLQGLRQSPEASSGGRPMP